MTRDNAEWMLAKFKEWGLEANIETFDVLFPTPKVRVVELLEPTKFTAKLQEPVLAVDSTSNQQAEQLPTYNAYSADGDVTAPLVYVNYGTPDDYEQLARMGCQSRAQLPSRAMEIPGAASSPKSRPSMARSDASSIPIPQTTAMRRATFSPTAPGARATAYNAAASWTCLFIPAIRSHPASAPRKTPSAST
jgi:hypothetical protein